MRPASCDDLQSAFDCVDALRDSVPARRPQELLDAICSIEVLARKTGAPILELVAGLDAAHIAGDQGLAQRGNCSRPCWTSAQVKPAPEPETPNNSPPAAP